MSIRFPVMTHGATGHATQTLGVLFWNRVLTYCARIVNDLWN